MELGFGKAGSSLRARYLGFALLLSLLSGVKSWRVLRILNLNLLFWSL
jgi:hypothetical protein